MRGRRSLKIPLTLLSLNLWHAQTGGHITKSTVSDFLCDQDRGFSREPCLSFKRSEKCIYKSSDAIYLQESLTKVIVEANSVDPDQQQSILCLHCLKRRLLKHFSSR